MNSEIEEYISKYPDEIKSLYLRLRDIILESSPAMPDEKLWAKLPSYYAGDRFIRLIPFKDHINIEAAAIKAHAVELCDFKLTPKGMLRAEPKKELPANLAQIFAETLRG